MKCRSEWQSPATRVRINTSRGPGFGTLTSSITSGLLTSCRTAAFIGYSLVILFLKPKLAAEPTPPKAIRQPRPSRHRAHRADGRRWPVAPHFPSAGTDRPRRGGDRPPCATAIAFAHRRACREYGRPPRPARRRWRRDTEDWWRAAP